MSHTNAFDISTPTDSNFAGDGDDKIVQNQVDLKQRLELDHNMNGVLDTSLATADGYHKKVTMKSLASAPAIPSGSGVMYTKVVNAKTELFYNNGTTEYQMTSNGNLNPLLLQYVDKTSFTYSAGDYTIDNPYAPPTVVTKTITTTEDTIVLLVHYILTVVIGIAVGQYNNYFSLKESGNDIVPPYSADPATSNSIFKVSIIKFQKGKTYTLSFMNNSTTNYANQTFPSVIYIKNIVTIGTTTEAVLTIS